MRYRFTGQYTNGHTGINANGIDFVGREPVEVTDPEALRRLAGHPEFEAVADEVQPVVDDPAEHMPFVPAKPKRAYKRKAAQ